MRVCGEMVGLGVLIREEGRSERLLAWRKLGQGCGVGSLPVRRRDGAVTQRKLTKLSIVEVLIFMMEVEEKDCVWEKTSQEFD